MDISPTHVRVETMRKMQEVFLTDFWKTRKKFEEASSELPTFPAPELVANPKLQCNPALDAWSLGVTLVDLLYGTCARRCITMPNGYPRDRNVIVKELTAVPEGIPGTKDLLLDLLNTNPQGRPSMHDTISRLQRILFCYEKPK